MRLALFVVENVRGVSRGLTGMQAVFLRNFETGGRSNSPRISRTPCPYVLIFCSVCHVVKTYF